jgi:eukaryotic-like serine/threonine-protein kinase
LARLLLLGALLLAATLVAAASTGELGRAVPAGSFEMGSDQGELDERPAHQVTLPAFRIDRLEVTQAEYLRCVKAGACAQPVRYPEADGAMLPAIGVSWSDASRYCAWAGKRLPTEAEWERAARGDDGRTYPWGAGLDCARANFGSFLGDGPCGQSNPGKVLPVGSRPSGASPVGALDMAGNVWEWVADRYAAYPGGRITPGLEGELRVVRGGSCCSYFAMPTTTNRLAFPADYVDRDIGFRCAR